MMQTRKSTAVRALAFLFSDIEGSTKLLRALGDEYAAVLQEHRRLLRAAFAAHGGEEQGTEGDSFFVVFSTPGDAIAAALEAQRALRSASWPQGADVRVRMGVHAGEALAIEGGLIGMAIHEAARVMSAAHGGQVLVSEAAADSSGLPNGARLVDLGGFRLKDVEEPQRLFQLGHDELLDSFPPPRTLAPLSATNLPSEISSFVGRADEIARVAELLQTERLVTLTGAGGAGKTRLAVQVARKAAPAHPDGIWFVDLAGVADDALVADAIAAALSLRGALLPPLEAVVDHLHDRRALLVLDNCEHVVAAAAAAAETILRSCADVRLLATSREALGVQGEAAHRVPSLVLPPPDVVDPDELLHFESVQLFLDRARKARPGLALTPGNARDVAELCRRLDGLPLALELAAARVKALTPERILQGLEDRFRLLSGGARTALARQQTLEASVDWSFRLLDEAEAGLLVRLAAFVGWFSVDAAVDVCTDDDLDEIDVVNVLDRLATKSLVHVEEHGDELRYRLLETIRAYAGARLADDPELETATHARHLAHAVEIARAAAPKLEGAGLLGALALLEENLDDLRAAMDRAAAREDGTAVAAIAAPIWLFWIVTARYVEGLQRLRAALPAITDEAARFEALIAGSWLATFMGESEINDDFGRQAITIAQARGDARGEARAQMRLAETNLFSRPSQAYPAYVGSIQAAQAAGDPLYEAEGTMSAGMALLQMGRYEEAREILSAAVALCRAHSNSFTLEHALTWLGWTSLALGRLDEAEHALSEAHSIAAELGDVLVSSFAYGQIAVAAARRGDHERSAVVAAEARALATGRGNPLAMSLALLGSGMERALAGDNDTAAAVLDDSIAILREINFPVLMAEALLQRAAVAQGVGDGHVARALFEEAVTLADAVGLNDAAARARAGLNRAT